MLRLKLLKVYWIPWTLPVVLIVSLPIMTAKKAPKTIEPQYVKALTKIERGRNDSNPVWSPNSEMIAFERSLADKKEIIITRLDGTQVRKIYNQLTDSDCEMSFFFPGIFEDVSYNAGISWSPLGDRFVFMSNGGSGNYDLYMCVLETDTPTRLTEHEGKDGQAQWSPVSEHLVFVSGRNGKAEIYLMDLENKTTKQLTQGEKEYLYPQWSPDGLKIVAIYGSDENHDIHLIGDVTKPADTLKALTTWPYDDLRPVWSPDGKKIAFYSNYNPQNDPKVWSIFVIDADGSNPTEGDALAEKIVASDVIPDIERGPAWMTDNKRIIYVKNDGQAYNPIYIVDIEVKTSFHFNTHTTMNHDITCSGNGHIAFRAQAEQWDHIYIAQLSE
jgi:TolB protein